MDILIEFFSNIISALIGGFIAYLIVVKQIKHQDKNIKNKESKDRKDKEIQLLWQIYFDIKKDFENAKLWEKYDKLISEGINIWGSPSAEYLNETLEYVMRDLKNFFILLKGVELETNIQIYNELDLLWERAGQLLILMNKLYTKLSESNRKKNETTLQYYIVAANLFDEHKTNLKYKYK